MEWINANSELPNRDEVVLCWNGRKWQKAWYEKAHIMGFPRMCFIDKDGDRIDNVYWWMRIEPPKEEILNEQIADIGQRQKTERLARLSEAFVRQVKEIEYGMGKTQR